MLRYFIQVIQNLLSTAILIALLSVLADKTAEGKKRFFVWGSGGIVLALLEAILKRTTRYINREFINAGIFLLLIPSTVFFIFLIWGLRKKEELREKLFDRVIPILGGGLLFYALPAIFLYPPEFLLMGQSFFSTDFFYKLVGFLAGLLAVILSGLAFFESAKGLSRTVTKTLLTAALGINVANQFTVIIQFLLARRLVSVSRRIFRIIVWIINHNDLFLYLIMALTAALPLLLFVKSLRSADSYRNPAEHRKIRAGRRLQRRWCAMAAGGYVIALLSLTVIKAYTERGVELAPAEPMDIIGNEIVIPLEKIEDGHLHRYNYMAADTIEMRFIVIKKNAVAYGVGLDACDICGPTGYYERKDGVICRLCDVVMNISTIGFRGGCNPVPLAYTLRSGNMVIATEDLEKERTRFK